MKIAPLPHGTEGEHLGISHTLKHYLEPSEVWEDLSDEVPPILRPRSVVEMLKLERWDHVRNATPARNLRHWPVLAYVHHHGYMAALDDRARGVPEPPSAPWFPIAHDTYLAHLGAGLLVFLRRWREGWELKTAYRTLSYHFVDWPLPTDPYSRRSRTRTAELRAARRMLSRLAGAFEGETDE